MIEYISVKFILFGSPYFLYIHLILKIGVEAQGCRLIMRSS